MDAEIAKLIGELANDDDSIVDTARERLKQLGSENERALDLIIQAFRPAATGARLPPDPAEARRRSVQMWLAGVVRDIGPKAEKAIPTLARILEDATEFEALRSIVAGALGTIGAKSLPVLEKALKSREAKRRRIAVDALRYISTKEAFALQIESLADDDEDVRVIVRSGLYSAGQEVVPQVLMGLRSKSPHIRVGCAETLIRINADSKEGLSALVEHIAHSDPEIRRTAVWAFPDNCPQCHVAVPALVGALKDKDDRVRRGAAFALCSIGKPAKVAVPALIEALGDNDSRVRISASHALGKMDQDSRPAVSPLIHRFLSEDDYEVRAHLIQTLTEIGSGAVEAVPILQKILQRQAKLDVESKKQIMQEISTAFSGEDKLRL